MTIPHPQTRQFRAFTTNLEYARRMVKAGEALAHFQSPVIDIGDFYRAAWVQAVSAIDHWFHEELYARVTELTADDSPTMPHQLTKFELPLARVEEVRRGELTLADAVAEHVRSKWASASLQNPYKITEALKLVTEQDVWGKAAVQLNEWNRGRTAMDAKAVKRQLLQITNRRNKIAHEADLEDGELKRRRPITEADVTDAINWIERIALAIAKVLD
ncbi:hypothetical protein [Streptomyces sp. BH104]|uniref:hypothetical protein n=1 Tax=Streptomyces sp. BH104 TaxID=3410407 RepID=UPI003BB532A4